MRIWMWGDSSRLNANHRVLLPANALAQRGHTVEVFPGDERALTRTVKGEFDVAVLHLHYGPRAQATIRELSDRGTAIVWDIDDDLMHIPSSAGHSQAVGGMRFQRVKRALVTMARGAEIVTTPSEVLADIYRAEGARDVRIVENYVPDAFAAVPRTAHDGLVIGWVAAREHLLDCQELGMQATLRRLLDAHEHVRVTSVGIDLGLQHPRYRHIARVPHTELASTIAGFDLAVAPLVDVPFNRARSNGKLKEYAAVGVPWLASPIGPYRDLGEQQGGRLVSDDGWYEELDRLATSPRALRKLAKRASRWGTKQTISRNVDAWENVLSAAAAARASAS